uniref:Triosephosphate isomeraseic-like n=1 Tax=Rhizophora mucronata TaxID=61149 RepID=A0A2P2J0N9_RHIMU
MLRTWLRIW